MKKLIAAFVLGVLSVVLLGAAGGSYHPDWKSELKSPEARAALSEYIASECQFDFGADEIKHAQAYPNDRIYIHPYCQDK